MEIRSGIKSGNTVNFATRSQVAKIYDSSGSELTGFPVSIGTSTSHIGQVGGETITPSANFTRPSDTVQYASGDLIANSVTAGSVTALSWSAARTSAGSFLVRGIRLRKSGTSLTAASFRVHLFSETPTITTTGDNGVFSTVVSGIANYLGAFDTTMDVAMSDGAWGICVASGGSDRTIKLASGQTIYGLIEAKDVYTPVSGEIFTAVLEVLQD